MTKYIAGSSIANMFRKLLGLGILIIMGWKVEGSTPSLSIFVMVLSPHTSNWDLIIILAVMYTLGIKFFWFGKKEIFRWPVGGIFKWLGGIPIHRGSRQNMVRQTVEIIQSREQIIVGISPEGTRSKAEYWKTGFYHIAHQVQIPIVFAYLDYARKVGGFGPVMETSGDTEADMKIIREFYSGITAKYPHKMGKIAFKPRAVT